MSLTADFADMSDAGNLYVPTGVPAAVTVEGAERLPTIGRPTGDPLDAMLMPGIDVMNAQKQLYERKSGVVAGIGTDFAMSAAEAGATLRRILGHHGLESELDYVQAAFINAMLVCAAVNGTSQQMPGRAFFSIAVPGEFQPRQFDLHRDVAQLLGDNFRRFFRAYARKTMYVLKDLQHKASTRPVDADGDVTAAWIADHETWAHVMRVAAERGITRYPYLVHDTADALSSVLSAPERSAVTVAKGAALVVGGGENNLVDNPRLVQSGAIGSARVNSPGAADRNKPTFAY